MPSITITGEVPPNLDAFTQYQLYNNFDAAITAQLLPVMKATLDNQTSSIYAHEMRLQRLCLEMSTKGFPIDIMGLAELLHKLDKNEQRALRILHACTEAIGFGVLNPNSPPQVRQFFYHHLGLPEQLAYDKTTRQQKVTTDIKALEKLRETYPVSRVFVNAILSARENHKMASVFRRGLEPDYRLRCNFSPSGTDTGRMSSQRNPFNRGTNAQNLTNQVRAAIAAPPGFQIVNLDLKTAESIAVGYISGDQAYIDACLTGDLHTAVARMNWPSLPWTGDLAKDKKIANAPYYRMFSYRDMAKRGGHGTNYYGTPRTMGQHLKLPTKVLDDFQKGYFAAFPGIPRWHLRVIAEIQTTGVITTAFGRRRRFWGRSSDPSTHRAAIAYGPQSLVADVMDSGLCNVMEWLISNVDVADCSLLAQVHDSGVFLIRNELVHKLVPRLQQLLLFPIDFPGLGTMLIPSDVTVGRRWYKSSSDSLSQQDYSPDMRFL